MNFCLSGPFHLPSSSHIKSCVILLHGRGSNGNNMFNLASSWIPYFPDTAFFTPNGPLPYTQDGIVIPDSFEWCPFYTWDISIIEKDVQKSLPCIKEFVQQVQETINVPFSKIVLGGFSQGSIMSLAYGVYERPLIGGVLGYAGAMFGSRPLPGSPYPPITLIHGAEDLVVPLHYHEKACQFLAQHHISYEEFTIPQLEHTIDTTGVEIGYTFLKKILENS